MILVDAPMNTPIEMTLPSPVSAGIHSLDLAQHGISLEPGRVYKWSVSVVQDANRRSNDIMGEGVIERVGASASLERSLEGSPRRFAPYALSGIWYDALAELREALAADPRDCAARKSRSSSRSSFLKSHAMRGPRRVRR